MNELLSTHGLGLRLGTEQVLQSVDLNLRAGQFVALLGPNGAGKTSLLRCLAGLQEFQEGSIKLAGKPLDTLEAQDCARQIAYLEQDASCHWPMTVEDVVALGRLPHRMRGTLLDEHCQAAVDAALESSDLMPLRHRRVDRLSGGERRRVMLARALATNTNTLLADEPASGLDPAHQLGMMNLLRSKAENGMLVVIVLHDLALAARYCDRLLMLDGGRIVADGDAARVLTPERLKVTYGIEAVTREVEGLPVVLPVRPVDRD